jgi:hypothetical protein
VAGLIGKIEAALAAMRSGSIRYWFDWSKGSPAFHELRRKMDALADELDLRPESTRAGRTYYPPVLETGTKYKYGMGVYWSERGAEFNLTPFRDLAADSVADDLRERLEHVSNVDVPRTHWCPNVPCDSLLQDWERTRSELIKPYFAERAALAAAQRDRPSSDGPAAD